MFKSNHCQFILTILLTTIQQNTKVHALPLLYQSIWLGFHVLSIIKGAVMTTLVKCVYTGPIGELSNTYTSQNTKHKKGFNVHMLHAQETNCELYNWTLKCKFNMKKTLCYVPNWTWWLSHTVIQHFFHSNLTIHYKDMTAPHNQEQECRLWQSHTIHCIQIWVTHLIVEISEPHT